jgi:hypothetical protein
MPVRDIRQEVLSGPICYGEIEIQTNTLSGAKGCGVRDCRLVLEHQSRLEPSAGGIGKRSKAFHFQESRARCLGVVWYPRDRIRMLQRQEATQVDLAAVIGKWSAVARKAAWECFPPRHSNKRACGSTGRERVPAPARRKARPSARGTCPTGYPSRRLGCREMIPPPRRK